MPATLQSPAGAMVAGEARVHSCGRALMKNGDTYFGGFGGEGGDKSGPGIYLFIAGVRARIGSD